MLTGSESISHVPLSLVWIIPFFPHRFGISSNSSAWKLAPCMVPISYGWAGGDCSLAAYIQSTLSKLEQDDDEVSALGAVMAFLYVTYIILYSVISTLIGRWVDERLRDQQGEALVGAARDALKMVGGVHFSVLGVVILVATFIPRGAFALNPQNIEDNAMPDDEEQREHVQETIRGPLEKQGGSTSTDLTCVPSCVHCCRCDSLQHMKRHPADW